MIWEISLPPIRPTRKRTAKVARPLACPKFQRGDGHARRAGGGRFGRHARHLRRKGRHRLIEHRRGDRLRFAGEIAQKQRRRLQGGAVIRAFGQRGDEGVALGAERKTIEMRGNFIDEAQPVAGGRRLFLKRLRKIGKKPRAQQVRLLGAVALIALLFQRLEQPLDRCVQGLCHRLIIFCERRAPMVILEILPQRREPALRLLL